MAFNSKLDSFEGSEESKLDSGIYEGYVEEIRKGVRFDPSRNDNDASLEVEVSSEEGPHVDSITRPTTDEMEEQVYEKICHILTAALSEELFKAFHKVPIKDFEDLIEQAGSFLSKQNAAQKEKVFFKIVGEVYRNRKGEDTGTTKIPNFSARFKSGPMMVKVSSGKKLAFTNSEVAGNNKYKAFKAGVITPSNAVAKVEGATPVRKTQFE